MKRFLYIFLLTVLSFLSASCEREMEPFTPHRLPDGTPVTITIPIGTTESNSVRIRTKVEALEADESRVHDLYVLIFDSAGEKFYGRFFTHEHMMSSLSDLGGNLNEGWYVDDNTLHKGAVKISTEARTGCTMVVIANVDNTVSSLDGMNPVDRLTEIRTLAQFKRIKVDLEQHILNRDDLFLMLGYKENVSTSEMVWYSAPAPDYENPNYNPDYKISLNRIDAKVKFRVKYNPDNISSIETRYWRACSIPSSCYLFPGDEDPAGDDRIYFDSDEAYFETEEVEGGQTYQVFTFYMLENRQTMKKTTGGNYYNREKQIKTPREEGSSNVINGDWEYAPDNGSFVRFDVILTLTSAGIVEMLGQDIGTALTTDAVFTVHLGDFGSSTGGSLDDYNTLRNHYYCYDITVNNTKSIYIEVTDEDRTREPEAGQEGSLLFAKDSIIQCDAHYNYYTLTFKRDETMNSHKEKISWNVKTPFNEGGAKWSDDANDWVVDPTLVDYDWVLFSPNEVEEGKYTYVRQGYPGDSHYDPTWKPGAGETPELLNIQQLIQYIFYETEKPVASSDFKDGVIRMTAFVSEFYYEKDPRTGELNPDLWREFVNAKSRELHILSNSETSADGKSDIVNSSHSIIQRSIQSIYNISSPFLRSIWGTEHTDEMRNRGEVESGYNVHCGWAWSTASDNGGRLVTDDQYCNKIDNGRYNTAGLWHVNPDGGQRWDKYLKYNVQNSVPELRNGQDGGEHSTNYQLMAYSCLTRNRDNNGNGIIDEEEIRWYLASVNQIFGLWVGSESLSPSARIYQPHNASSMDPYEWRSHIVTSTCKDGSLGRNPTVVAAEEGSSIYDYYNGSSYGNSGWDALGDGSHTEKSWNMIQSVRCIRNAGTFVDDGVVKDISYSSIHVEPDMYYESLGGYDSNGRLKPTPDGSYTLRFDNLNTKSLREYSAIDLPYHDEHSFHNRVYLEMNIQNPEDRVDLGGTRYKVSEINDFVTQRGYNPYCPTGYRLPNMVELSVMRVLMSDNYWKDPNANTARPSRTYFSKGSRGSQYPSEADKIGWVYSFSNQFINLTEENRSVVDGFRCVRDNNMIGEISGKLLLSQDRLHVNSGTDITFNFTSSASAITEVALALCYVDPDGNDKELSIPVDDLKLEGMTLRTTIPFTIPADLPVRGSMSFKATLRNAANHIETFTAPVSIISDVNASLKLLPYDYDHSGDTAAFPVLVNAMCEDENVISSWKLYVKTPDNTETEYPITPGSTASWSRVFNYTVADYSDLQVGTYVFRLLVKDTSGTITRSSEVSMDVLFKDEQPNGATWEVVSNGAIGPKDFIEAKIDMSGSAGYYRDNIISVGTKIDGASKDFSKTYAFHLFYPDNRNNNKMIFDPVDAVNALGSIVPYFTLNGNYSAETAHMMIFRMDNTGVYWNGMNFNAGYRNAGTQTRYETLLTNLNEATKLHIGSVQGDNRSHSDYKYVRVVHNGTSSANLTGSGSFEEDPGFGGNL